MNIKEEMGRLASAFTRTSRQYSITSAGKKLEIIKYHDGTREVRYNNVVYSRINPKSIFTHSYWDYFLPLAYLCSNPKILMIGLGGGTIAYQFEKARVQAERFDIVEVDRDMIEIAKVFYPEAKANIIEANGLDYIKGKDGMYDLIILDAYINYSIPSQFTSREFIGDAYAALTSKGVLAINYLQDATGSHLADAFIEALKGRFDVYTLETRITLYNAILIASKSMGSTEIYKAASAGMPKEYAEANLMRSYANMKKA
ncbi:MAG: fused MFS/spermidine synthase [Candidatus Micrarchaeaceae archaeon]|nr:fused MFS/spermidine synthase [Candidatus Marsarchaeota archaeon]